MATSQQETPIKTLDEKLLQAAKDGTVDDIKNLLREGADAKFISDPPGGWGSQSRVGPLHLVLQRKDEIPVEQWREACSVLLEAGADPNEKHSDYDWRGCGSTLTGFQMAIASEDDEVIAMCFKHGSNPNEVQKTSIHSMRTDGSSCTTMLNLVTQRGSVVVVRALLEAGADVDALSTEQIHNERGYNQSRISTALHVACKSSKLFIARLLLDKGANPNITNTYTEHIHVHSNSLTDDPRDDNFVPSVRLVQVTQTPVHIAIKRKNIELVKILLAYGADASIPFKSGATTCQTRDLDNFLQRHSYADMGDDVDDDSDNTDGVETKPKTQEEKAKYEANFSLSLTTVFDDYFDKHEHSFVWSPQNHRYFATQTQQKIFTLLCVAKRNKWVLPVDVTHVICQWVAAARVFAKSE